MSVFSHRPSSHDKMKMLDDVDDYHLLASPGCTIQFVDVGIDPHVLHVVWATLGLGSFRGLGFASGRPGLLLPLLGLRARHLVV